MTNRQKVQLAIEAIIAFGLKGTKWDAWDLRDVAKIEGAGATIQWEPAPRCTVWLHLDEYDDEVRIRVEAKTNKVPAKYAAETADMLRRVTVLACQIESGIATAERAGKEAT